MQVAKDLNITILLDVYGQLLTEKQRLAIDMYYNEDLSLAEIGEETGISRQGARDTIKQGEKHLLNYEEKLGIVKRFRNISTKLKEMNELILKTDCECRSQLLDISKEISKEL